MTAMNVYHALGLHMHQPPGNLKLLIDANPEEAERIIRCYERPLRYALRYTDVGHLHIGFSGVLLEQLRDPAVVDRYRHIVDIPEMLAGYREADNIELIGMGYFHPIFPLIPPADWEEQLRLGRDIIEDSFGRAPRGFWPSEMAFSMDMVPALVRAGYEYVVVEGVHVPPEDGVIDVFRPYLACEEGLCISVVPRDRDVSDAQASGLDASWFAHEVTHRCRFSPRPHEPRLVTTWSDGENGDWFRQPHEGSGFFGHYYAPYMEHVRGGEYPILPVSLSAYLQAHPPAAHAHVQTGAWNVGTSSGVDFSQWAGSEEQRDAARSVSELSRRWWSLAGRAGAGAEATTDLARARRLILEAETSCFLLWGDDRLAQLRQLTTASADLLERFEGALAVEKPAPKPERVPDSPRARAAAADASRSQTRSAATTAGEDAAAELSAGASKQGGSAVGAADGAKPESAAHARPADPGAADASAAEFGGSGDDTAGASRPAEAPPPACDEAIDAMPGAAGSDTDANPRPRSSANGPTTKVAPRQQSRAGREQPAAAKTAATATKRRSSGAHKKKQQRKPEN